MIRFSEYARTLKDLNRKGFIFKNNVYQKVIQVQTAIRTNIITWIGPKNLWYIETSSNENSIDGELIRSGKYTCHDFGKLFIQIDKFIILAKINPFESRSLNSGFITEQQEFIIDIKENI